MDWLRTICRILGATLKVLLALKSQESFSCSFISGRRPAGTCQYICRASCFLSWGPRPALPSEIILNAVCSMGGRLYTRGTLRLSVNNKLQHSKSIKTPKLAMKLVPTRPTASAEGEVFQKYENKTCRIKHNFYSNNFSFRKSFLYEIMYQWYCIYRLATDDTKIRRMRLTFRITKATDTHSEYAISIAFLLQKMVLHYKCVFWWVDNIASKTLASLIFNYLCHENGYCMFRNVGVYWLNEKKNLALPMK